MKKNILKIIIFGLCILLGSCVSLSEKARQQNIRVATSPYMIEGMENIYAFSTQSSESITAAGIKAANSAANNGFSNITVLVRFIGNAGGYFVYNSYISVNIYEISYWK